MGGGPGSASHQLLTCQYCPSSPLHGVFPSGCCWGCGVRHFLDCDPLETGSHFTLLSLFACKPLCTEKWYINMIG